MQPLSAGHRSSRLAGFALPCLALVALVSGALVGGEANALQVIEARDGVAVEAIMSAREPTRIRIDGAAIVDVFGNVQSTGCGGASGAAPVAAAAPVSTASELLVECDRDKGEIYVRPNVATGVGDHASGKPVNLFISSAYATYTLLLRRANTPADTIVLRDSTARPSQDGVSGALVGPAPSHVRAMKALLLAMASEQVPSDVRVADVQMPVTLWADTRFALTRRYEGRGLVGEKYLLQNTGPIELVLAEPQFDRPDSPTGGQVLGVAIEQRKLRPGETTNVFVIRRGGQ
jgi:conjugal transfer pilus assembly protein TraK